MASCDTHGFVTNMILLSSSSPLFHIPSFCCKSSSPTQFHFCEGVLKIEGL
uniref:Uncharacterized protein n=1 Tax=Physcomitrium patens TaxID=3218 RepID=A0A2K1IXL7_PHYPA|nr:hypothetical protein PHYPA_023834 [Physcomitrium patens]